MFWKKKIKLPITLEDKEWIDEDLKWLKTNFGEVHFNEIRTITPTKDFYNIDFTGKEEDAQRVLERTKELMAIKDVDIKLDFFSDQPVYMDDGSILSSPADVSGAWSSATGIYQNKDGEIKISIEREMLRKPIALIATIAHELAHQILLGENRIEENDEFLTDLTAIVYGFGIFIGNSRFNFSSFSTNKGNGWSMSNQGYLPEQIIAYAIAKLSIERKEEIEYVEYFNETMKKFFLQSITYLEQEELKK
ncbi:hypothetical protein [Aquimarina rhabdastrellae]